jgi:hypothetical protein
MTELYPAGDTGDSRGRNQLDTVEVTARAQRSRCIAGTLLSRGDARDECKSNEN